jgi:hypothetical protein
MFTLKHVESDGHEALHEATRVWREPHAPGCVEPNRTLWADVTEGQHPLAFCTGSVYVMNAAGKTVATYHFEDRVSQPASELATLHGALELLGGK